MNREFYFNYIKNKISCLVENIRVSGKLNILSLNVYCEAFYCDLLNKIFDWELESLNKNVTNFVAIDLVDHKNKIIVQVSSQSTNKKIEDSLSKDIIKAYNSYTYYFICIIMANKKLLDNKVKNPYNINFDMEKNFIDVTKLLNIIFNLDIEHLINVYNLIKKELGNIEFEKINSDLADIVSLIDLDIDNHSNEITILNEYQIEKKIIHNSLSEMKEFIHEKAEFYGCLNRIYQAYLSQGKNKQRVVLSKVSSLYIKNKQKCLSSVDLYFEVFYEIKEFVKNSANYNKEITEDNLEFCIHIILIDAFIKCKIFESPEGYYYVNA